jgi:hypothetical protein
MADQGDLYPEPVIGFLSCCGAAAGCPRVGLMSLPGYFRAKTSKAGTYWTSAVVPAASIACLVSEYGAANVTGIDVEAAVLRDGA